MNEILETIGIAAVRISHLETQLAAAAAELERLETVAAELVEARYQANSDRVNAEQEAARLTTENAALRAAELSLFDSEIDDKLAQVKP